MGMYVGENGEYRFSVSEDEFDALDRLLNNPPTPNNKLRELLAKPEPWAEKDNGF